MGSYSTSELKKKVDEEIQKLSTNNQCRTKEEFDEILDKRHYPNKYKKDLENNAEALEYYHVQKKKAIQMFEYKLENERIQFELRESRMTNYEQREKLMEIISQNNKKIEELEAKNYYELN